MFVRMFHRRYLYALSVLVLSVVLLLIIHGIVRENERVLTTAVFERDVENYTTDLQSQIDLSTEVVESIAGFFNASVFVERDEFRRFVATPLFRHAQIQALEWIPAVADKDRAEYEKIARADGMNGFQFTERESRGVMNRAGRRPWYFPAYYVEPFQGNETALGFDLGSDPTRMKSIRKSIETGAAISSGRIVLVQRTGDRYGFLIFRPVYRGGVSPTASEGPMSGLQGFALGVFIVSDLVTESLKDRDMEGIGFYLFDDSALPGRRFLYHYDAAGGDTEPGPFQGVPKAILQGVHYRTHLSVPGREWSVLFYGASGHYGMNSGRSFLVLTGGLIFIGLLCGFLWTTTRHAHKVEGLLSELSRSNIDLKKEMAERRKVEANLHTLLQEKEILLKEIHHRVKNNLQMVSGLLNLQGRHAEDEKAKELYRESENRVMSMALIHENLYRNRDLGRINFADYVRSLAGNISSSYGQRRGNIVFIFDLEKVDLIIDTAIPAGLIINELITNVYKHAFSWRQDGEVRIGFHGSEETGYVLTVADNGAGMPVGKDLGSFNSLGINLVRTLVELLGGSIEIHRENGTMFRITFREYREAGTELH